MRQASWNEMFGYRHEAFAAELDVPQEPSGWKRMFWWEDLLTFALLVFLLFVVIASVNKAHWADTMPSLETISLCGLFVGLVLSKIRWPEGFLHLIALPIGAAVSLAQILWLVDGPSPVQRFESLTTRMGDWFAVAAGDGISNDELPFIVLVVPLTWLAAYASAWAVFRWRNAWLALVPGGIALLGNISLMSGHFSVAFVLFLLAGALLVTRVQLLDREQHWRKDRTPYPEFLSLSVLNATFWVAIALLVVAWLMPRAEESSAVEKVWDRSTAPAETRFEGLTRLFLGVNAPGKGGSHVHNFEDLLPFLGSIELPETEVADVTATGLSQPRYLRSQTFDVYSKAGWRLRDQQRIDQDASATTQVDELLNQRRSTSVTISSQGETKDELLTVGQPLQIDKDTVVRWLGVDSNVTSIVSSSWLAFGDTYNARGSLSYATESQLRAAGTDYPSWVRSLYLQLPEDLPLRVSQLSERVAGDEQTPYDQAVAIENYLRSNYPYALDVPDAPPGQDAVDFFLFEAKRGYFDYHASAMVVMLRSQGIPSRLAIGYALDPAQINQDTNQYNVTEQNAFAWPEVYFPGLGWVEFNPTPSLPSVERPLEPLAGTGANSQAPGGELAGLLGQPGVLPTDPGTSVDTPADSSGGSFPWLMIFLPAGLVVLLVAAVGALAFAWLRGLRSLAPAARMWEQAVRLASWARVPGPTSQTPFEYAASLQSAVPGTQGIDRLADAYVREQFGHKSASAEAADLERIWRQLRGRLLQRLFHVK